MDGRAGRVGARKGGLAWQDQDLFADDRHWLPAVRRAAGRAAGHGDWPNAAGAGCRADHLVHCVLSVSCLACGTTVGLTVSQFCPNAFIRSQSAITLSK